MLHELIEANFFVIVNIVFLLVFLHTNTMIEKDINKRFLDSILILIAVTVVENIDIALEARNTPSFMGTLVHALGYCLRPWIIYVLILIVKPRKWKERKLHSIPGAVNCIVALSALFTDVAFRYDENNQFIRGPLGYTPHICSAIYLLMIFVISVRTYKERNYAEAYILSAMVVTCVISVVLESVWKYEGLLRVTGSLSITFFYLYYCSQHFRRDALTKTLNRHCFYQDAEHYKDRMSAVISVDLNNLKKINDTEGHAAGDVAICTAVNCIRECLIKGCFLYRTGGDEFMILCLKSSAKIPELQQMIASIHNKMAETPYSCAIGIAEYRLGEGFHSFCARADAAMYEDKMKRKMQNA